MRDRSGSSSEDEYDADEIKRLMMSPASIHREMQGLHKHPDRFSTWFKDCLDINYTINRSPESASAIFSFILTRPEAFSQIIKNARDLDYICETFSAYTEQLYQFMVKHPQTLTNTVKSDYDYSVLKSKFKHFSTLFDKKDITDVVAELTANKQAIQLAMTTILDEANSPESLFQLLPPELLIKIAAFHTDPAQHDSSMAESIAQYPFRKRD